MKTFKILLALMVVLAGKTHAQEPVETINSTAIYAINTVSVLPNKAIITKIETDNIVIDAERSKTFSKTFIVDANDKISLSNQYGVISIKTWDKKEVRVDVDIKAYSTSDNDAQKLIDAVAIDANKVSDMVSFKTNINTISGRYGKGVRNGVTTWRRELKVNYTVYLPSSNPLTVMQQYGNVNMGDFDGPTSLKVEYGNLTAGKLINANNYISVKYGKMTIQDLNAGVVMHEYGGGINIAAAGTIAIKAEYVPVNVGNIRRSADIKVEYGGGLTIGSIAGNLLLNTTYAKVHINSIKGNTVIKQGYGSLNIENVAKLALKTEYTNVILGSLNGDASIDMEYNGLSVGEITNACKNFGFNGEYASLSLGFADRYNANFSISTSYAGFKYGSNVSSNLVSKDDETKKYAGKIGNGSGANITIKTEYGSIIFK